MSEGQPRADEIAVRLRQEDARLRSRTLWYSLLPVAIGAVVLGLAWSGVQQARSAKAKLDDEIKVARQDIKAAEANVQQLKSAVNALLQESASLQQQIDERRSLLARLAEASPAQQPEELAAVQQTLERDRAKLGSQAVAVYNEAIQATGGSSIAYRLQGAAQYRAGNYEQAASSLRNALKLAPADSESRATLALALWALGQSDEALGQLQTAFEDPKVQASVLQDPAYKPLRDELDTRNGAASGGSQQEKTWIQAGLAAAKRGDFAAAINAYDKALQLNPRNATVLAWQGYALYRGKRFSEAIKTLQQALKIDPKSAVARYNLALALWKSGSADDAKRELEATYRSDPGFEVVARRDPQSASLRRAMSP